MGNYNWWTIQRLQRYSRRKRKLGYKIFLRNLILTFGVFFLILVLSVSLFGQYVIAQHKQYFTEPKNLISNKIDTLTIFDRNGEVLYRTPGRYNTEIIPLKEISPHLIKATLATEDGEFYEHEGFSLKSTVRALLSNIKNQDPYHQGGSTITQQLSRTLFLNNQKSFTRKAKELLLSFEIERKYSKQQILELYLNTVYYGAGAYGAPEAAKIYFNKDVKDLNLAESTLLAGLTVAPTELSLIDGNKEKAFNRQSYILSTLEKKGQYSDKQIKMAKESELKINKELPQHAEAPHFSVMIKQQLEKQFPNVNIDKSGFRIYTTIDKKMQLKADELVKQKVSSLNNRNVTNGAFLATNPQTGEILALVGSVNYSEPNWGSVNVLTSPRSPGSSIKPLIYAAALESKTLKTSTILSDEKTTYQTDIESYTPVNSDNKTRGQVLPRIALANSLNIPAVEVISKNGLAPTVQTVKRLGISNLGPTTNYGLSFALGGLELQGIDLAASYATLANGGYLIKPWGINKVEDRFGNEIWTNKVDKTQVLDPKIAYIITNILSDEKARELLFGKNNPLNIGRPAAVKTGTSQDFKNAWTVGYTPSLLALSWVGNNDSSPMKNIWGLESAALIWNQFMKSSLANLPVEPFSTPTGLKVFSICPLDGSKAVTGEPSIEEVFVVGDEPTEYGKCGFIKQQKEEEERKRLEEEKKLQESQIPTETVEEIPVGVGNEETPQVKEEPQEEKKED